MADIQLLYARRIEAASIAVARGDRSEAERLYTEALTMGEENFGATSPQLAVPLNELSRLYVHLSAHAKAEPLLQRLLKIRCADGESHPGVATVLAALAAVRRGLGDDAAAEDLYRRALAIREVAHAPEHMAVVVVVEQLADTCAARGKFAEAKALLERALPAREQVMGAEHATVRGLRARMADFAVKAAPPKREAPVAKPAPAPVPVPVAVPVAYVPEEPPSNQLVFIYEPEKPKRRTRVKRDSSMTPPFSSMVAAASIIAAPAQVAASQPPAATEVAAPTQVAASQPPAATQVAAPSLVLTSIMDVDTPVAPRVDSARAGRDDMIEPRPRRVFSPRADVLIEQPRSRASRYAFAAMGMTTLAGALFVANAKASSGPRPVPVAAAEERPVALAATVRPDPAHVSSAAPMRMAVTSAASKAAAEVEKPVSVPTLPGALPTIGDISIPVTEVASADSAIRASSKQRDIDPEQLSTARLNAPTLADDRAEKSPVLIGSVPQPRFPDGLRSQRIESPVIVQFLVGTDGRVDASTMKVMQSPHELLSSAVRAVLPRFRFEPARSADAKPRAEWVQYSFEFGASK